MIPILYDSNESSFTSNGIGRLRDAISCEVTEERHGMYELSMVYDINGLHYKDLEIGRYIVAKPNAKSSNQIFHIYDITRPINGKVTVSAEHISYRMRMIPVMPFTATGVQNALVELKAHCAEDCPFTLWTNKTDVEVFTLPHPDEMRGKLQGDRWSILQEYGGEYEFDNFTVKLWDRRGVDTGEVVRYGKNIIDLKQEENIQNTYTGIVPYWYGFVDDDEQETVYLPEKVIYSENVSNFPYHRTITVDFTEDFLEKPTEAELRQRANRYLSDNEIGIPAVNITLDFVDLSQTEEYKNYTHFQTLGLCDTVKVVYEKLGVSTTARINRTVYDVLKERYTKFFIGDIHRSLAVTIANQGEEIEVIKNNTIQKVAQNTLAATNNIVDYQTALITGNEGGYLVLHDSNGDGQPDELLIMDTASISTAEDVWRWNMAGLAHSSTGYEGTYTLAITADGKINADFIQTGTLNAALVNVINLVAEHVTTINSNEDTKIEIDSGQIVIYRKVDGNWVVRGRLQQSSTGSYARLYFPTPNDSIYIDISPLGCSFIGMMSQFTNLWVQNPVGGTGSLNLANGAKLQQKVPTWVKLKVKGTDYYVLSGDNTSDVTIDSPTSLYDGTFTTGSVQLNGAMSYNSLLIIGQVTNTSSMSTILIPTVMLTTTQQDFQFADNDHYYAFHINKSGSNVVLQYKGRDSTGQILKIYGV